MSLASDPAASRAQAGFGGELKFWRRQRRMSQIELALAAGVSQRHVSFLESGRARPSRGMVLHLARTLEVPLRARNELLLSSGFAPAYASRGLDDPALAIALKAMGFLLARHDPFPAVAFDRNWSVIESNKGMSRLASFLATGAPRDDVTFNGIDYLGALVDPNGSRRFLVEGEPIIVALLEQALREATMAQDKAGIERVRLYLSNFDRVRLAEQTPSSGPLPRVTFARDGVRISLVTIMTEFAAPCDAALENLKQELFYPADETTAAVFTGWTKASG